jgi:hypothetical protein
LPHPVLLTYQAEQEMLGADIAVIQFLSLFLS